MISRYKRWKTKRKLVRDRSLTFIELSWDGDKFTISPRTKDSYWIDAQFAKALLAERGAPRDTRFITLMLMRGVVVVGVFTVLTMDDISVISTNDIHIFESNAHQLVLGTIDVVMKEIAISRGYGSFGSIVIRDTPNTFSDRLLSDTGYSKTRENYWAKPLMAG